MNLDRILNTFCVGVLVAASGVFLFNIARFLLTNYL